MSLINDALKRARDVDRKRAASPPAMSLKPVEPVEPKSSPRSKWLILAIVGVALGLSLWSFSRWAISTPPPSGDHRAGAPETSVPLTPPIPPASSEASPAARRIPPPELGEVADASAALAAVTNEGSESLPGPMSTPDHTAEPPGAIQTNDLSGAVPARTPAPAPEFRLQSIIYRHRNPAAIINGQWLEEGQSLGNARVLKIEPHQVTLQGADTNLVLEMPRY